MCYLIRHLDTYIYIYMYIYIYIYLCVCIVWWFPYLPSYRCNLKWAKRRHFQDDISIFGSSLKSTSDYTRYSKIRGVFILTRINVNPSMYKWLHQLYSVGWNYKCIPKLQRCNRWSLGTDSWFHPTPHWVCDYLCIRGLNVIHLGKRGPIGVFTNIDWLNCHGLYGIDKQ